MGVVGLDGISSINTWPGVDTIILIGGEHDIAVGRRRFQKLFF